MFVEASPQKNPSPLSAIEGTPFTGRSHTNKIGETGERLNNDAMTNNIFLKSRKTNER